MSEHNESIPSPTSSEIAAIDSELLRLLHLRIQAETRTGGGSILRRLPESAASIAARLSQGDTQGLDLELAIGWLQHADSICRRAAHPASPVVYLGPIYSYSYLASVKFFGSGAEFVPVATIAAAFDEIVRGQAAFGVVPVENSTDGRVVDTLGMFARSPVEICGEVLLPIHHCLLGRQLARNEVGEVHSKPQALSQCRNWLSEHLPDAKLVEVMSTAAAAATAANNSNVAAIASREAGIHQGLRVIDENIEDNQQNVTRFVVIGNCRKPAQGTDKTSLMFQLSHKPGSLAAAMTAFQTAGINLTWIESFPLPNCPNEYLFFVELEGHRDEQHVSEAIAQLRILAVRLEVLGSYPKGS
ncbi:MAG: prephenate dehydratase [Planctomycetales bacterium]|nr:prephenate dehydratase [Planctomycetales bacterium]